MEIIYLFHIILIALLRLFEIKLMKEAISDFSIITHSQIPIMILNFLYGSMV